MHLVLYRPVGQVEASIARVVKLVDTRDLKSLARKRVPVRLRPRAPIKIFRSPS